MIRVERPTLWLLHIELQSSRESGFGLRLLRYNSLLQYRHRLPVASVAVLMRQVADAGDLTGIHEVRPSIGPAWEFRYEVLRVWERPVPFAPLAHVDVFGVEIGHCIHERPD